MNQDPSAIIGVHDGHNAAAALLVDGRVVAALQEERLTGVKNQGGLPARAIDALITAHSLDPREVVLALNGSYVTLQAWTRGEVLSGYAHSETTLDRWKQGLKGTAVDRVYQRVRRGQRREAIDAIGPFEIQPVEHHVAHAAAAYFGSGWSSDRVLVLTADGCGDRLSATANIGHLGRLERLASVAENDSLGQLYAMVTYILGMVPMEHEYKVMGLAPYVEDEGRVERAAKVFHGLIEFDPDHPLRWRRRRGVPPTGVSGPYLRRLLRGMRFDLVAAGLQRFLEDVVVEWVRRCISATGIRKVALGGGLFMNVRLNQRILAIPEVSSLFVFPSCGDESNAIGAAYMAIAMRALDAGRSPNIEPVGAIYYGPAIENTDVERAIKDIPGASIACRHAPDADALAAAALAEGRIVARVRGPMEFGARALGNRSILARPDRPEVVREINSAIKNRDFWMPFAPSILSERADDYVLKPKAHVSPHMMVAYESRLETRASFVAAQHAADHTARAHEVLPSHNPEYHRFLELVRATTGHGVVLNTSMNLHGLPMVANAAQAIHVFRNSSLSCMALGDWWLTKQ